METNPIDDFFLKKLTDAEVEPSTRAKDLYLKRIGSNPVDVFFSNQLTDAEVLPSERAKALFLKKIASKTKKPFFFNLRFISGIAASIFFLGFLGLYLYQEKTENPVAQILNKKLIEKTSPIASLKSPIADLAPSRFSNHSKSASSNASNATKKVIIPQQKSSAFFAQDLDLDYNTFLKNSIQAQPKIEEKVASDSGIPKEVFSNEKDLFETYVPETLVYLSQITEDPSEFEIRAEVMNKLATAQEEDALNLDRMDQNLLIKIIAEIKHIRKGEKLDINSLNLNPKDQLARNDEGFIATETRQLKEKYNWIKSKLSNF